MKSLQLLFVLMLVVLALGAQQPYGYQLHGEAFDALNPVFIRTFDHDALLAEDAQIEAEGGRTNNGRLVNISLDERNGQWSLCANGGRVWHLRLTSPGAAGMSVQFDDYHVAPGAELYLFNVDRTMFDGPYTSDDNNDHGLMNVGYVTGDDVILEYYEPYGTVERAGLGIRGVGHFYRYVYNYTDDRGGSEFCEVDVNCPEGDAWQAERDAVVRLEITDGQFLGLCSGAMVNTTAMDCRRYLLTALHCALDVSNADFDLLKVRFRFQRSGCGTGSAPTSSNRTGVNRLADSNDGGGESGSDFLLLEIEDELPASFDVFYAGWDATGSTSGSGVCIHHPAGDVKKISTYDSNLQSVFFGSPGSHWEVEWVETETNWGVTEGGSSGSPLFTDDHLITGHLTGGLSFCNNPDEPDYYGKVSKDWDGNPNPVNEKLKEWLDPIDSGQETMFGSYVNEDATFPCGVNVRSPEVLRFSDVEVFPTLSDGIVNIRCDRYENIETIRLHDAAGRLVRTFAMRARNMTIDLSDFSPGFFYLNFISTSGSHVTKKISRH
jgi:hypothetical protein